MTAIDRRAPSVRLRPTPDLGAEIPALWAVQDAARVADGEIERNSLQGFTTYYSHLERCDPARDLIVAEADGQVVAYARVEWNDSNDGERWYEGTCHVHPDWRRRGLGSRLLAWTEVRRWEIAADHEAAGEAPDRARAFTTFLLDGDRGGATLLTRAGYVPFRRFASMRRTGLSDLPAHPLPDGIEIRPVTRDRAAMRQVFDADVEAFRDHFGWTESSDEKFEEFIGYDNVDPAHWVVAFDGDEVAGASLNGIHTDADGGRTGWLDSIFTRRPWRKRGLARALIARSLALLRDQGFDEAYLGVDLANANQALALYESCGFAVLSGATAYRKPVPATPFAPSTDPEERAS
ncbi:MAG TPA: GNAT family N-acetyltransferase [Candidatus Limnocylindrales bacterium]|nr:GNAT family N-acetyltransferase [Candidatus Limnocylindrales bacterium]